MIQQLAATKFYKRRLWLLSLFLLVDCFFFSSTNPFEASPLVATLGGVLITINVYVVSAYITAMFASRYALTRRQQRAYTALLALPVAYIALMQSIGQLNLRDVLALAPLVLIFYFYLTRMSRRTAPRR